MSRDVRGLDDGSAAVSVDAAATAEGQGPFSRPAVAGLLGVAIVGFCALVVLAAYAPDLRNDEGGGGSALSNSAVGFAGIVQLLRETGVRVAVSRVAPVTGRRDLLVLTPPPGHDPAAVRALMVGPGATLVILPKWQIARHRDHPGWVEKRGALDLAAAARPLPVSGVLSRRQGESRPTLRASKGSVLGDAPIVAGSIDALQTLKPSPVWQAMLTDEAGQVVLARWVGHNVFVLADPDLVDTQGLQEAAAAQVAVNLMNALRDKAPITFDVTLNGFGAAHSLLRLLFEPPLLGATLCTAAAALAVLLMAVRRFGPAMREPRALAFGKRALADNAARLIARAGRERDMGRPYAQAIRDAAMRSLGGFGRGGSSDAALDAASRALGLTETYSAMAAAAGRASDRGAVMDAARRLHLWALGVARGR